MRTSEIVPKSVFEAEANADKEKILAELGGNVDEENAEEYERRLRQEVPKV